MEQSSSQKEQTVRYEFDRFCKLALYDEKKAPVLFEETDGAAWVKIFVTLIRYSN